MESLLQSFDELIDYPWVRPAVVAVATVLAAYLVRGVVIRLIAAAASKTKTELDDRIIEALRRPVFLTVILLGLSLLTAEVGLGERAADITNSILQTIAILVWAGAGLRVSVEILSSMSERTESGILQQRTIPIFDIVAKAGIIGGAVYFVFLAWEIDVTAWMASAGIVGIAVGFAAKDTLANLFAGLFIIADAPYRMGDYIVMDGEFNGRPLRGEVTRIGIRSSRILTRDDVEITIPNALLGNSKIINETGGPSAKNRVGVMVGVAYSSDVDLVSEVLLQCVSDVPHVAKSPAPEVRFRDFGDSSLDFEILFWTAASRMRGLIRSRIRFKIWRAFKEHGIEIPFPQRDLWVKDWPDEAMSVDSGSGERQAAG